MAMPLLAVTLLLSVAGAAWACTVAPHVSLRSASGPAGTNVTVVGDAFPDATPVEIRWHTKDGPVVGSAQGSSFSTEITIPSGARPGFYYVVAIARPGASAGSGPPAKAAEILQVVSAASPETASNASGPSVAPDLWSAFADQASTLSGTAQQPQSNAHIVPALAWGLGLAGAGGTALLTAIIWSTRRKRSSSSAS